MPVELDTELLEFFREEANGLLPQMQDALARLEQSSSGREAAKDLHRLAHSIKGSAAMLGLMPLSQQAMLLEDFLEERLEAKQPVESDSLIACQAAVKLIEEAVAMLGVPDHDAEALLIRAQELFAKVERAPRPERNENDLIERYLDEEYEEDEDDDQDDQTEDTVLETSPIHAATPAELQELLGEDPSERVAQVKATQNLAEVSIPSTNVDVDPELLEVFSLEAEEHLVAISTTLPLLQAEPTNKDHVQAIRRSAHTLKGASAMVGFRPITKLAHRMEDLLDLLYEAEGPISAELFPLLYHTADALADLATGQSQSELLSDLYAQYDVACADLASQTRATGTAGRASNQPEVSESEVAAQVAAAAKRSTQSVRVPIERFDELTKLASELVIARTVLEQRTAGYTRLLEELQLSSERLKRCATKLEKEFEVRALAGFGAGSNQTRPLSEFDYTFDTLEFDRYTDLHLISRELAETTADIETIGNELTTVYSDVDGFITRETRLTNELQDKLMRSRMVPFSTVANQVQRTVRTTAEAQGKNVTLRLEGETTEVDKTVLEEMAEPLLHLIRNAVDHGQESPTARIQAGKPVQGTLTVRAASEGTQVVLAVSDDGRGIDTERVRNKAIAQGLLSEADAATLPEGEIYRLLFMPGFSTAAELSEISGRGVGLDIVQAKVEKLKGSVSVASTPGQGTTFTIRLPLNLAITKALFLTSCGQKFALPQSTVEGVLRLDDVPLKVGSQPMFEFNGALLPLVYLDRALRLDRDEVPASARPSILVLRSGNGKFGLVVDEILSSRDIVIKPLGNFLRKVRGVNGVTLQGDGSVVLILNTEELLSLTGGLAETSTDSLLMTKLQAPKAKKIQVMIVDDSPSVRRVLSNLVENTGWEAIPAKDGRDALDILSKEVSVPDVILSDVEMPRMDGYELLSAVKGRPALRKIPVVMITSRAGEKHRNRAKLLGANGYLVKPYQDDELIAMIRSLMVRR